MINSITSPSFTNYSAASVSTASAPKTQTIEFSYNSQDQVVKSAGTTEVQGVYKKGALLNTSRVKLGTALKPNQDGSYVYDQKTSHDAFTAAHTFATVNNTLQMFQDAYGEKINWAFGNDQIKLNPDQGEMLNAYYARDDKSINFFHATDRATNEVLHTGDSGEVVSHEVGHAILDGIRPSYLETWGPDPSGFHESFGDMVGFMMATQDDDVCQLVAQQTGGDLTKDNSLSLTGEELGVTIGHEYGQPMGSIRNANNNFKWSDPSKLPENAPDDRLGTEMHSWSRLYTGTMYEAFTNMVNRNMAEGQDCAAAIKDCGKQMIELYAKTLKDAPEGEFTYEQMANCMLKTDREQMGGKNQEILRAAFTNRNIIHSNMNALDAAPDTGAKNTRLMTVSLDGGDFGMFAGAKVKTHVDADKMSISETSSQEAKDLKANMQRLIKSGRVLYTEPNQKIEKKDLFDSQGRPYIGVVRWVDGEMTIERNAMIG